MFRYLAVLLSMVAVITLGIWRSESHHPVVAAAEPRESTATATTIPNIGSLMVAAGHNYSCALLTDGTIRCWGENAVGQLGLGNTTYYGDDADEVGSGLPTVNIGQTAKYITAGEHNVTCAIRNDNQTVCWGNGYGYLLGSGVWNAIIGDSSGEMGSALTPVDFGTSYAVTLSQGDDHMCALLASGAVKCWGQNADGQLGINGTANFGASAELGSSWPAVDLNGHTAVAVSAGAAHTCAILDTGAVTCWGQNTYGQLGYGDTTNRGSANLGSAMQTVNLGSGKTATAIAAGGYFTCAILNDGTLKCWGYNATGQLGQDSTTTLGDGANEMGDSLLAVNLGDGRTAKSIYASRRADLDYTCAILDNDTLKCWGANEVAQLGVGDMNNRGDASGEMAALGTVNLGTGQTAAHVAMGERHTCVLLKSAYIKCFGNAAQGQLGYGSTRGYGYSAATTGDNLPIVDLSDVVPPTLTPTMTLTKSKTPSKTKSPTKTYTRSKTKSPTKTFTRSKTKSPTKTFTRSKTKSPTKTYTRSKTATPTITHTPTITQTPTMTGTPISGSLMIAAGHNYSCAVLTNGAVKCWGENYVGQLGLGDTNMYGNTSSTIGSGLPTINIGQTVKYIAAGESNTTCAIRADDKTVCWGSGNNNLLGTGLGIANMGDQSGEMGSALTPIDFGSSYAVTLSEGDNHICALLASGAVKCWGYNDFGQLGVNGNIGTTEELASWPAVDLNGRTAVAVSAGAAHTCAILNTGAVTCWGLNTYGQLGYGDTTDRGYANLGSAMQTVNLGTGRTATAIAAGGYFTCAILDNGTLKCWGYNASGQLGKDSTTTLGDGATEMGDNLTAINLGSGRTASKVYASRRADLDYVCAILDNNALKCWGQNDRGQLGVGDNENHGDSTGEMALLSTVNLGSGQTAAQVAMGEMHTCVLLTSTDIKCFGRGYEGQLGNGTGADYGSSSTSTGDNLPLVNLGVVY
ncbi:MAG: hypothetical protein RLY87_919 [Chloroflexota bacterium]